MANKWRSHGKCGGHGTFPPQARYILVRLVPSLIPNLQGVIIMGQDNKQGQQGQNNPGQQDQNNPGQQGGQQQQGTPKPGQGGQQQGGGSQNPQR